MLLAVDIGNTNIVFALYDGRTRHGMWRCRTDAGKTGEEYLVFLSQLFELSNLTLKSISDVLISSVVPDIDFAMERMSRDGLGVAPVFVGRATGDLGVQVKIDRPSELGADRLVNTVAVKEEYKCAAIVIDFGTATTFDVIDEHGDFIGGVIAPGPNLSMAALSMAAAKLPRVGIEKPKAAIAKNTVEAMQAGVFWGYVGLVEKTIEKICQELGMRPKIIATGGLATLFKEDIPAIDIIDNELTLKGLLSIYLRLKKQ